MTEEIRERIAQIRRGEIPDGYKQTKAGILPDDWESKALQTLCEINPKQNGDTPSKVAFIGMSDTDEHGNIISQHIVPYGDVCRGYTPFLRGDVLVAKITPCFENGKGAYTENLETESGFGSTEFHVLRSRPDVSGKYVFFHTQSGTFRKKLRTEMTGSAGQKRVQTAAIASYHIAVPPLEEQKRIADILSAQDNAIRLKERLIEEKRRQKKWLMQQFLTGKRRLSGYDGDWRNTFLYTVSFYSNAHEMGERKNYVSVENMQSHFGTVVFEEESSGYVNGIAYRKENVLIGNIRPYLQKVWRADRDGVCSADVLVLQHHGIQSLYFYYLIARDEFFAYVMGDSKGSKMPRGDKKHIMNMPIRIPVSEAEQRAIADILSMADREIQLLERELSEERRQKKALSQLLLSGLARV